jgi:hypothetical protein
MSSSDDEMKPRAHNFLTSRLEMVEAHQSRVALVTPDAEPASLVLLFLPMVSRGLETRNEGKKRLSRKMSSTETWKVKMMKRPPIYSTCC